MTVRGSRGGTEHAHVMGAVLVGTGGYMSCEEAYLQPRPGFMIDYNFFFFQAEDGIRDLTVTGVQTCALTISCDSPRVSAFRNSDIVVASYHGPFDGLRSASAFHEKLRSRKRSPDHRQSVDQIGRASCRERV